MNSGVLRITFLGGFILLLLIAMKAGSAYSQKPSGNQLFQNDSINEVIFSEAHSLIYAEPDSARKLIHQFRKEGADQENSVWNIRTLNLLGIIEDVQSNFDTALYYYYQAYTAAAEMEDYEQLANTCNNIGLTHWHTGNNKDALEYFFHALEYYDKVGITETRGNIYNNIGLIYAGLENYEKATEQIKLALENFRQMEDQRGLGAAYTNLGLFLRAQGEPDSAHHYIDKSIKYKKLTEDKYGMTISLESKGRVYLTTNNLTRAEEFFNQSLELSQSINNHYGMARAKRGFALIAMEQNNYPRALQELREALDFAQRIESEKLIYQIHEIIAECYENTADHRQALEHFKRATELKQKSINHYHLHQVYDLEMQHAAKKSLQEIEQLNQEKEIQQLQLESKDLELRRKNTTLILFTVVIIFTITGGYFLYANYRQGQQVKFQKAMMQQKEDLSRAAIEAEISERKRIGQELHDGLGQMLSIIRMNMGVLNKQNALDKNKREELFDSAIQTVDEAFKDLRNISQNISPAILSELTLEQALHSLAKQVNQTDQVALHLKTMGLSVIQDNITKTTIYRAVQELVNNALKHADTEEVSVQVISDEKQVSVMVEDNGKGFDVGKLQNAPGAGIRNIKTRIENLSGSFFMDSRENRGSIFQIFIPLNNNSSS